MTVAGHVFEGSGEVLDSTFSILDVDTTDVLLEIAIPEDGPSDDYATTILRYAGGRILPVGKLEGTSELHADGSGVIRTKVRAATPLGTWFRDGAFRIGASGTFEEIVPERYRVGLSVRMACALTLPAARGKGAVHLRKGEAVTLESTDDQSWVDIGTSTGAIARCPMKDGRFTDLHLEPTDVFEGLSFAD